ncbi:MAG: ATP-binding cassette domain-containing protein [Candidatus Limivicinus sp.]|jgi:NitT/TauT family transport system ATP-binding protein
MAEIRIKDLCFSYGGRQIIKNLNLTLAPGNPVVLLGKSGRGKTTLMRLIAGFLRPDSGEISGISPETRLAVMFQEDRLFPQLTVYKNLKLIKKDLDRSRAAELLNELNLEEGVLDSLPSELSGGMKRRVALIRALIFDSQVLLLDEPFQGLDGETRKLALAAVRRYSPGRASLIITHEPEDAEALDAVSVKMEDISEGCEYSE